MFVQLDDLLNLTKLLKRPYTHADIPSKSTDSATTVSGDDVDHLNVVVLDRIDADGSFLVHHLLCTALQCDLHVCMVSFSQLFSHYVLIARKMVHLCQIIIHLITLISQRA